MPFQAVCSLYALVMTFICLIYGYSESPLLMIGSLFIFLYTLAVKSPYEPLYALIRLTALCGLHYASQLDWSLTLYLLTIAQDYYTYRNRKFRIVLYTAYLNSYIMICMQTSDLLSLQLPVTIVFYILNFICVIAISQKIVRLAQSAETLNRERNMLITHDTLTGLWNYEECHKRLSQLLENTKSALLVIIDCTDLKTMNNTKGFQAVDTMLKQIADLLNILFSEAEIIARYGGDEFAVAFTYDNKETAVSSVQQYLDYILPNLTGIGVTYGIACYPDDGSTKDGLVLEAEHQLYQRKRDKWLKKEEHLLRTEKLRVVGELASGMAHEIRNPLTTVKGFLQIAKENEYNIRNWYELIMDEIKRMSELTSEFLQFSKPHATQFRIHSLHSCILRVIWLTSAEGTKLGHEVVYQAPAEDAYVLMDEDKIVQMLMNLIKNAYEAMQKKGKVTLRLSRLKEDVVLEVEDTGTGIPQDRVEKIFTPFYTTKETGTGLGLSICHKIVQDHGGTMEVESFPENGTKFIITFPIAEGHPSSLLPLGSGSSS
jgi:diguanylate cyclase (GGDEF)-like protein